MDRILGVDKNTLLQIAETYDTPCYVYSQDIIRDKFLAYKNVFGERRHQICYAVKANSNLAVISLLAKLGAGFDIVSVGELQRVMVAGGDPAKTIFSGVGKKADEIAFALTVGIEAFDVESLQELEMIIAVAQEMQEVAPISIRFNPDVDAKTHPYISTGLKDNKFGLMQDEALLAYQLAQESKWIEVIGINMHIGSQLTDVSAYQDALGKQAEFVKQLKSKLGIELKHINVGGGLGVDYQGETIVSHEEWVSAITTAYPDNDITLIAEPGRFIVANAGVLLSEVLYTKTQVGNDFAIIDAGMNDYARVALYQAYNHVINLTDSSTEIKPYNIVGPICESGDTFAKARELAAAQGDILAMTDVGAYGFVMASNYNTRGRAPEVMLIGKEHKLIRQRESLDDQIALELVGEFALDEGE